MSSRGVFSKKIPVIRAFIRVNPGELLLPFLIFPAKGKGQLL